MTDDIHALSGAYAVDALDDIERAQFEQHLAVCPVCQNEVTSLCEAAALLAETTVLAPPAHLRELVLAGVATVRPLPPIVAPGAHRAETPRTETPRADDATVTPLAPRRRRRAASFLAAAAAVVAVGAGGAIWQQSNDHRPSSNVAEAVMTAPDHQTYTQTLDNGVTATIYRSNKLDKAVLITHGFPLAQSGKEYALWLLHDGAEPQAAGVLPRSANNEIVLSGDAATATAAGITVENAGTTPTSPSAPMFANINFQET